MGSDAAAAQKRSYKETLNLPRTTFGMKANLVQNEPASLKRWEAMGLYQRVREARKGKPTFLFHDGPPYANGSIHLGHLMNKCLKDFVVRSQTMAGPEGRDCPYVPGWDCHGLPIEHKVMTELVESGKFEKLRSLDEGARQMAVRRECRKYAEKYVKLQAGQMQRLLTLADYDDPYLTMNPAYEGAVLEVLADLVERGLVYRALKPVHWSIANETALAEAELEYEDREDISVYVDFECEDSRAVWEAFGLSEEDVERGGPGGAVDAEADDEEEDEEEEPRPLTRPSLMIWTTTPWTLPANLAVAVNPRVEYALVRVDGNVTIMARALVEKVTEAAGAEEVAVLALTTGDKLVGLRYRHPFVERSEAAGQHDSASSSGNDVFRVVAADYVTLEDGTGLVHTAPGHGTEDYQTGLREGLPIYCPVRGDGTYDDSVPEWLRGRSIWEANEAVTERLRESGHLFYDHKFLHSYPHDWRSKTPVIFRCTEQWFVGVDAPMNDDGGRTLRDMALKAVERPDEAAMPTGSMDASVRFVPEWGRNRMRGMLESRPDWCISRQRAWGLPIPCFFLPDGSVLMTAASVRAVAAVIREKGSDAWFTDSPETLLARYDAAADPDAPAPIRGGELLPAKLTKGRDILDVWFESGSSWNAVLRERGMGYPADLYLEGSDQHRGWFQLSLLPALGATGKAPFKTLLTHGFMVGKDGRKLSKSKGDTVEDLFRDYGADVLRWWVCSLSYENDVKVDREFFNVAGESYRKVRNTLRFMLSNLSDYTGDGATVSGDIPPTSIDAWVLGELDAVSRRVTEAYERYDFRTVHAALYDFCNHTLSAIYLAAVKDRLYCDAPDSPRRRRTQATLFLMTDALTRLLAPVLCHTADEAYRALRGVDPSDSKMTVHVLPFLGLPSLTADPKWAQAMRLRERALQTLEKKKAELGVENPLDAGLVLPNPDGLLTGFDPVDLADLLGVSRVTVDASVTDVQVLDLRSEPRCERSWKRDGTVRERSDGGMLTDRDAAAVGVA